MIFRFTAHHLPWLLAWMTGVSALYFFTGWKFIAVPWEPLTLIGTAVALYALFKSNQSYDRLTEAGVAWGAITNNSRKLATLVLNFRTDDPVSTPSEETRKEIIHRQIAYAYQLREQLLEPMQWEHVSVERSWRGPGHNRISRDILQTGFQTELDDVSNAGYMTTQEKEELRKFDNGATQLLNRQTQAIQYLFERKIINAVQQANLQAIVNNLLDEQGKAERIKRFPYPRKYAGFSFVFVCIFIFLLPFGIAGGFSRMGKEFIWLTIPIGVILGWMYVMLELIGDYTENPFEGLPNDIPMLSICRNIEIDLLQISGETRVPDHIHPKDNVLL